MTMVRSSKFVKKKEYYARSKRSKKESAPINT